MTWLGRLHRLYRQDRAGIAAVAAILLTSVVALTGAAVDIGMMAAVRSELQNAADAAALAGAATIIGTGADNSAVAQPEEALAQAMAMAYQNTSQGINLELALEDITLGLWQEDAHAFDPDHIGATSDPDSISACRVIIRRDLTINSPVPTIFLGILGIDTVNVSAMSTGHLGWAGTVEGGQVDLPIAVKKDALTGSGLICGQEIVFHDEGSENSEWTTFFTWPTNDPSVKKYVNGTWQAPALEVGDEINVINGNLSNNTFSALNDRFQSGRQRPRRRRYGRLVAGGATGGGRRRLGPLRLLQPHRWWASPTWSSTRCAPPPTRTWWPPCNAAWWCPTARPAAATSAAARPPRFWWNKKRGYTPTMRSALPHTASSRAASRLRALWRGNHGAMAALAAFLLTASVGLVGAAVDVGLIASTHNELQNAADAAALAGAGTMLSFSEDGSQISGQPAIALATAQQVALANQARPG